MSTITPELVLISAVNGFIASTIAHAFLTEGYAVRGTARSQAKADAFLSNSNLRNNPVFRKALEEGRLEVVVVEDISVEGAFDHAVEGVHYFCHTASPVPRPWLKDNEEELLLPALKGTLSALHSAGASSSLKKFISLSSMVAIVDYSKASQKGVVYDESHWNALSYEEAKTAHPFIAYGVSKTIAEKAIWDYVEDQKPTFKAVALNPTFVYGESYAPLDPAAPFIGSNDFVASMLLDPEYKWSEAMGYPNFVDARDLARAHVLAAQNTAADGRRFLITAPKLHPIDYPALILQGAPELVGRVSPAPGDVLPTDTYILDTTASEQVLGLRYHTPAETLGDTARWIIQTSDSLKASL